MNWRICFSLGSFLAALAVILGAFAAHALKNVLPSEKLVVFETGVRYQMYHALALLAVAFVSLQVEQSSSLKAAAYLFTIGIVLFSGSLYLLSLSSIRWLGFITPFGGVCFIAAWILLGVSVMEISD